MSEPVRLFIVTDNPDQAVAYMFECPVADLPAWARVACVPAEIAAVPRDVRCQDLWYSGDDRHPAAVAWQARKRAGKVRMMNQKDWDHLVVSISRRSGTTSSVEQPAAPVAQPSPQKQKSRWH